MSQARVVAVLSDLVAHAVFRQFRPGVEIADLSGRPEVGAEIALLRYAPGATVPEHLHRGFELILVLSGSQSDDQGTYPAGTVVINRRGQRHRVWRDEGCVVLIAWQHPVELS